MKLQFDVPETLLEQPDWVWWSLAAKVYFIAFIFVSRKFYRSAFLKSDGDGRPAPESERMGLSMLCGFGWPVSLALLLTANTVAGTFRSLAALIRVGNEDKKA